MKSTTTLFALVFAVVLLSLSFVSAASVCSLTSLTTASSAEVTTVGGTIYQNNNLGDVVPGASVTVVCADLTQATTSDSTGNYKVLFPTNSTCTLGSDVTVTATKASMSGENTGEVTKHFNVGCISLNVGVVNVPLVPEFGLVAGMVTIFGALVAFFFVRKN